jgi:two-component system sensor histidine kinase KdpD
MRLLPYLVSAASVTVVGLAAHALMSFLPLPHVSVLFLAAVVTSAVLWGFWPSVFAAVLSVAASSYFFYWPIFSFKVAAAQDVADLAVFIIVAALTSQLGASVRARAIEARRQQDNVARLLAFTERLADSAGDEELEAVILEHLSPVLGPRLEAAAPRRGTDALAAQIRDTAARVAAEGGGEGLDAEYVKGLLSHASLALERARLRREVGEARLKVQGEALREALINSVSHDLQTPLAAILGSATALETFGEQGDARARRELVETIREESQRLAAYIENVLDLTRIRSGQIAPRLEWVELSDIVDAALRRKRRALSAHAVEVRLPPDLPMLRLDLFLMEHALANVLDNAAKYAPPGSRVSIAARVEGGQVELEVADVGPGIPADELARIFDPFYRGSGAASGTGLGLAICRAFVEANGGSATALSRAPGRGTTLRLRLPVPEGEPAMQAAAADD